ncbi:MAG: hypothetical protein ACM3N0_04465 [Chloroflexota bacterium]
MDVHWMAYRQFPYERELGLRELEALGLTVVADQDDVTALGDPEIVIDRATYFDRVSSPLGTQKTVQAQTEAAHLERRGKRSGRQVTRYGLHGIHEYKGKFNPQVVRALCNIVDYDAQLLVDPFCGSGTALIEGMRLDKDVIGIDRSPMAAFLATTKMAACAAASKRSLRRRLETMACQVSDLLEKGQANSVSADLNPILGAPSTEYLEKWFTPAAFAAISQTLVFLYCQRRSVARQLAFTALSSILRTVSLQLPDDLRIRRRPTPFTAPQLAPLFADAVEKVVRGLREMDEWAPFAGSWSVHSGHADDPVLYNTAKQYSRSLVLTSPPYATALPYVDTDRLSLVALGLTSASCLAKTERDLVGSREWSKAENDYWTDRRAVNQDDLPDGILAFLESIAAANAASGAGFRRQAVPSLLYRYFTRMSAVMGTWAEILPTDCSAVMIVGRNRTTAGGERVEIPTSEFLGEIAEMRGFKLRELLPLETWPRYGLHSSNGVTTEDALILERVR